MEIYEEMDKKRFFRAAILDTEKVLEETEIKFFSNNIKFY